MDNVEAKAVVNTLADTAAQIEARSLADTLCDVDAH